MRTIIQRVKRASVTVNNKIIASIEKGLLIFIGIEDEDNEQDVNWLCAKIARLRIFADEKGLMNISLNEINGGILVVSQFTLHASTKKGNRPSFIKAAKPEVAVPLYNSFIKNLENETENKVQTGEFGAYMDISLVNDGPVTIFMDTKNKE